MTWLATTLTALVALLHLGFLVLEMFLWTTPFGLKTFRMTPEQAIRATQVTARYPAVHGAPVHVGDPAGLGIDDVRQPDYGDPEAIRDGEIPVVWASGVTPQAVAAASRPELMITHAPGHMFVTDVPDARWAG